MLTELLRLRIKIDSTLDKLVEKKEGKLPSQSICDIRDLHDQFSCVRQNLRTGDKLTKQAEDLMRLHDELAELKAENGKGTPNEKPLI